MREEFLKVRVFCSPLLRKEGYEGKAEAVSSENKLGKFDILPRHSNFITLIFNELTLHLSKERKIVYHFKRGVLEVIENKVNIFLGI